VINEPLRRGRVTGTDLLGCTQEIAVDLFGIDSGPLGGLDLPQEELHSAMARRRFYLHTTRWTSLGLSLVEAMHLGMPVVAVATTEAPEAVPSGAGVVSNRPDVLHDAAAGLVADPDRAHRMGEIGRRYALERYGLERFLKEWNTILEEVAR
jgi:glycosyltransferase involved in cell wall biosynthesis